MTEGASEEVISSPSFDRVFLYEDTAIETIERHGGQAPIFASTGVDSSGAANPDDPADLTTEQKQRTLTLRCLLVSERAHQPQTPNPTKSKVTQQ